MSHIKCQLCSTFAETKLSLIDNEELIIIEWPCNCHDEEEIYVPDVFFKDNSNAL